MSKHLRNIIFGVCVLAIAASLVSFLATGMHPYTRFRDEEIEAANAETDLSDLFAETSTQAEPTPEVESVNAIGLLPSGPGAASISVTTISGPAVVIIGLAWWLGRRTARKADHADEPVTT